MSTDHQTRTPALRTDVPRRRGASGLAAGGIAALLALGLAPATAHADEETDAPTVCESAHHPEAAAAIEAAVAEVDAERDTDFGFGVSAFGGDLTCGHQAGQGYDAASTGKVIVLATLLWHVQEEGRELTAREDELATAMITVSDNDATIELRNQLGRERMQEFLDEAGMPNTVLHPENYTGLMKINAAEELHLLGLITQENDVLCEENRAYARELMGGVIEEQRWGVPAGAPAGAETINKNGWLPYDGTDVWRVNSIGAIDGTEAGPYRIAILTDRNAGMAYGVETIELLSAAVHDALHADGPRTLRSPEPVRPQDLPLTSDGSDRA
ncbi:beta-lactamase class A [Nocardiopsis sp. Huas11]|uniref:serine hydrolase n=1 Tax=Nocardiopsis sp. Huas11 TaxID=2183912 RepID=UPI000EB5984C|nr:serine hydrolase [Nocardiopsis sp. Huas11]RKS07286.1 beta-lactamase class A [Nocardiopsis sp. Huas11]